MSQHSSLVLMNLFGCDCCRGSPVSRAQTSVKHIYSDLLSSCWFPATRWRHPFRNGFTDQLHGFVSA